MAEEQQQGNEPFETLAADPKFRNYAKEADALFNTTLSQEIANTRGGQSSVPQLSNPSEELARSQTPSGQPLNLKTQAYLGGNFATGPNPGLKSPDVSSREYAEQISNLVGDPNTWSKSGGEYAKPYSYDSGVQNLNFDRYYNHPKFAQLGWSPYRDNELVYNENSSWWDDFNRMRGQFTGLAGQGFKSMYGWTTGDSQKFDRELANQFTKKMGIMNSSKEGFGASLTNFAGNAAYTVGIMSSFLLEEAALWGATALSGGTLGEITVPESIAAAARMMKGVNAMGKPLKAVEKSLAGGKAVENIATASRARELYKFAKQIVPLQNTRNFLSQGAKILDGTTDFKKLKDFAFLAKGTGSLYRDLREINAVMAESDLEGGMVRNEMTTDLLNEYYDEHGTSPEEADAEKIYAAANEAGLQTRMANIPTIYLSNKLVFGKMIKGWRPSSAVLTDMIKGGIKGGTMVFNKEGKAEILKGLSRYGKGIYWKSAPSRILKNSLRYGKANLAEGIQEWSQEVVADQARDYYKSIYSNPGIAGSRQFWASLDKGVENQLSGQGLEVFLSGFFMGGLVQGPQNLVFQTLNEKYTEYTSPEQFTKQKEARAEWENRIVNAYNATKGKGIIPFFNVLEQNMVTQSNLEKQMSQAELNKDRKEVEDIKDESLFTHMNALYRNGGAEHFIAQLEAMKELTPEEQEEAFPQSIAEGDKNNSPLIDRIDKVIARAKQIEAQQKEIDERFPNPFDPGVYSRREQMMEFVNESIDHYAFEEAKKQAIYSTYAFGRAKERIHSLVQKVGGRDKPLANIDATDITALFDPEQLSSKIKTMTQEIATYSKGTPEQKANAEKLKAKRDSLKSLGVAMANYVHIAEGIKKGTLVKKLVEAAAERDVPSYSNEYTIAAEAIDNLEKAYFDHVKLLGKQAKELVIDEKIAPSFESLIDYMELDSDAKSLAKSINILYDPEGFRKNSETHRKILKEVYDQRETLMREAYQNYLALKDKNELLVALGKAGVWIKPEDVEAFDMGEFTNIKFFSVTKPFKEITKDSPKYVKDIKPKLDAFLKVSDKMPADDAAPGSTPPPAAGSTPAGSAPAGSAPVTQNTIITFDMTFEEMDAINPEVSVALKKFIQGFINLHATEEEQIDITDPESYKPALRKAVNASLILKTFNDKVGKPPVTADPSASEIPAGFRIVPEGEALPAGDYTHYMNYKGLGINITNAPAKTAKAVKIVPVATIGTPGTIVYASPTLGKSSLAIEFPEQYVDGDQILADFMKDPNNRAAFPFMETEDTLIEYVNSKRLNISPEDLKENFAQKAGLIFYTVTDNEIYADEIKEAFDKATEGGKIVLTSNQFAIPWASEAYLIEQSNQAMRAMAAEFKKRTPSLGKSRSEQDANRIMSIERAKTKGMKVTEVPGDKHLKDLLTVEPEKVSTELKDRIAQATGEELEIILNDVIEKQSEPNYLQKQQLTSEDVYALIAARKEELGESVEFENISVGDILIMKSWKKYGRKGMVKVIKKNPKSLVLVPETNKNQKFTLPSTSKNQISYVYKKGQAVPEIPGLTPEAEAKSKETIENLEASQTNVIDVAAALGETEGKTAKEIRKDFKNKPKPDC